MIPIFQHMAQLRRDGRRFAVATVVRTLGSTPQVVGAKLVLDDRNETVGTLGGGCVEADAMLAARDVLAGGGRSLRAYALTEDLAWNTGLVCGGTMWILAERDEDALGIRGRDVLPNLAGAAAGDSPPVALVTLLERAEKKTTFAGRLFVNDRHEITGSFGDAALDDRAIAAVRAQLRHGTARVVALDPTHDLLIDAIASKPRIVIAGGGHVALALAKQALLLDFDVVILEDRPEFADPVRFAGATILQGDVPATLGGLDYHWNSFIVVATRGHKLDADCVRAAVRTPARYIGLLGSRRKTVLIAEMLRSEGVDESRIEAIHAPVGLDLGGRTPAEIALAVLAEITQERYQASGRPLRQCRT